VCLPSMLAKQGQPASAGAHKLGVGVFREA
jgi:hypothetical protein